MNTASSAVKQVALERGLALFQPDTLRSAEAVRRIAEVRPQALIVAAYGMLLPQPALDIAPLGALNIHASLLPRWRGAAPIQRALLAGDARTGISIMRMDAGLDTGPLLSQREIEILPDDDAGTLHDKLAALGAQMMERSLEELEAGRAHARPQPQHGITYAAKLRKEETHLDWNRPAEELERAVRAYRPSPGAMCALQGEQIKVWRSSVKEGSAEPGRVLDVSAAGIVVACGRGALVVQELQRPGARRLSAAEFLRGRPLAPGTRLQ